MNLGYTAIMVGAVIAGVITARFTRVTKSEQKWWQRVAVMIGAFVGAAFGAKVPWLLSDLEAFVSGAGWFTDGRTITFGMVGAYLGVELAKWGAGVTEKTGDSLAVPAAVSIAIGRLGCFYAGCCFGAPTTLAIGHDFGDGIARHPTQLYETAFHLSAAVVLYALGRAGKFPRQRVKLYFIAYFVYRFFTEFIRPEPEFAWSLTLYQLASLAFIPLFAFLWWLDREPRPATLARV